jgi:hypothetical protein
MSLTDGKGKHNAAAARIGVMKRRARSENVVLARKRDVSSFGLRRPDMRRAKIIKGFLLYRLLKMKKLPLFPLIPLAPGALLFGSFLNSIRALRRVKRLEHQIAAGAV